MADLTKGQRRNARLLTLLGHIATDGGLARYGEPSLPKLSERVTEAEVAAGRREKMSRSLYQGIERGSTPDADTLLATARWANVNPLTLFEAAGWIEQEDIRAAGVGLSSSDEPDLYTREDYEEAAKMRGVPPNEVHRMLHDLRRVTEQFDALVQRAESEPDKQTHQDGESTARAG